MLQPEDVLLQLFQQGFQQKISAFVEQSPEVFTAILHQIYGEKVSPDKIEGLIVLARQQSFPLPATIVFGGDDLLKEAYGAYHAKDGGTVYLQERLMKDPETLQMVFNEEIGHHLDEILTPGQDSPGDEGFMFRLALDKGAPLDDEELKLGRSLNDLVVVEEAGESLELEIQKFPAPIMKALQVVTQNLTRSWFHWRLDPDKLKQAFDVLAQLMPTQRLTALNTLFIQTPKKAKTLMDNLVDALPEALPEFMHWFTGDKSDYGPATLQLYSKYQVKFHNALVANFRKAMLYGKADWQIQEAHVCEQITCINQLPIDDRNAVLSQLFKEYQAEIDSFFSQLLKGIETAHVKTTLFWLTTLSPVAKHALMGCIQGELFTLLLQALNRLSIEQRREVILGFGPRNWIAKLYLEKLWALLDGDVVILPRLESALEGLMARLDMPKAYTEELSLYQNLFQETTQKMAQEIVTSLEDEDYLTHRAQKSKAHFRLRRLGVEDTLAVIECLRQAYIES